MCGSGAVVGVCVVIGRSRLLLGRRRFRLPRVFARVRQNVSGNYKNSRRGQQRNKRNAYDQFYFFRSSFFPRPFGARLASLLFRNLMASLLFFRRQKSFFFFIHFRTAYFRIAFAVSTSSVTQTKT